jgi:hypothetical protein
MQRYIVMTILRFCAILRFTRCNMSCHRHAYAGSSTSGAAEGSPGHFHHIPRPLKFLGAAAALLICPPVGVAALAWAIWSSRRGRCGGWRAEGAGPWARSGNSAFEAKRRETLEKLAEEERAFAEFRRRDREARDREAFERFQSEQAHQPPKTDEQGPQS